jgi:hypothetical protein
VSRRRTVALGMLLAMAAVSVLPPPWKGHFASYGLFHDGEHIAAFCAAFLLLLPGTATARREIRAGLCLFAFGFLVEALQSRVYGIRLEYTDIFNNGLGVAIGFLSRLAAKKGSRDAQARDTYRR